MPNRNYLCLVISQVRASCMSDWKHAYILEANSILGELCCYYTKASYQDEVLGLPISFTVNPATQAVDYIEAHPDLLSISAFKAGVKKTPTRDKIDAVLPVYLTADHFERALPYLPALLKQLAPEKVSSRQQAVDMGTHLQVKTIEMFVAGSYFSVI